MLERLVPLLRSLLSLAPFMALLLIASPVRADVPAGAPVPTASVLGRWYFAERSVTVDVQVAKDGTLEGRIVGSPRQSEVGHKALRGLVFDAKERRWEGTLNMPDAGEASVTVSPSPDGTLRLVARRFVFSKVLLWTRPSR